MIEALLGKLAVAGGTEVVTAAGEHFAERIKTIDLFLIRLMMLDEGAWS